MLVSGGGLLELPSPSCYNRGQLEGGWRGGVGVEIVLLETRKGWVFLVVVGKAISTSQETMLYTIPTSLIRDLIYSLSNMSPLSQT